MTKKTKTTPDTIPGDELQPITFFQRGDEFEVNGKQVKVVEVIADGRYHVKNKAEPFDSFIVLDAEIETSSTTAPDLLYRPEDRTSL